MAVADFVLSPALTLSVFLAAAYTVAVHLFMGIGFRRLLWHWLLAAAGMAAGAAVAARAGSRLPTLGDGHIIEGSLVALAVLLLSAWRARLSLSTPAR